jgi:hypothetical protein
MNITLILKTTFKATILSILVFLSVSFITVLCNINPLHYYKDSENYKLNIGFPFVYYEQFWLGNSSIPNSGWNINNLFLDIILTWILIVLMFGYYKQRK